MPDFDLTTTAGRQAFEKWVTVTIRNEINSYVRQVLFDRNATYIDTSDMSDADRIARLEQAVFRR